MTQSTLDPFKVWTEFPLACADLETTGPSPTTDRVVTGYVATIRGSEVNGNDWLLDPGIEISEGATAVHGISTEKARADGMDYEEGLVSIWAALQLAWAGDAVVATFNGSFDITMLVYELRRLHIEPGEVGPIFDGFVVDKHFDPRRRGKRKLTNVCEHYGVKLGDAHNADADALAAARLAWKLPRVYPELAKMTVAELQAAQTKWYREQATSLVAYWDRIGKEHGPVATSWPIQEEAA